MVWVDLVALSPKIYYLKILQKTEIPSLKLHFQAGMVNSYSFSLVHWPVSVLLKKTALAIAKDNLLTASFFQMFWLLWYRLIFVIVLQYGSVTRFVVAFSLAPFFALLNNLVKIWLDGCNFIHHFRRPVPERNEDMEHGMAYWPHWHRYAMQNSKSKQFFCLFRTV